MIKIVSKKSAANMILNGKISWEIMMLLLTICFQEDYSFPPPLTSGQHGDVVWPFGLLRPMTMRSDAQVTLELVL